MDEQSHYVTCWKVPEGLSKEDALIYGQKYCNFRLPVLKLNPEAFQADYVYESSLSKEDWAATIATPSFHYFVALATPRGQNPDPKHDEWVGSACFYGPHDLHTYNMIGDRIMPSTTVNETYWNISSCHTSPRARMGYVFGLVMHSAYDWINQYTLARFRNELDKPTYFRLSGSTQPVMKNLLGMYLRKGFTTRGVTSVRGLFRMRGQNHLAVNSKAYASDMDAMETTVIEHYVKCREGPGPHPWFGASDRRKKMMGSEDQQIRPRL